MLEVVGGDYYIMWLALYIDTYIIIAPMPKRNVMVFVFFSARAPVDYLALLQLQQFKALPDKIAGYVYHFKRSESSPCGDTPYVLHCFKGH